MLRQDGGSRTQKDKRLKQEKQAWLFLDSSHPQMHLGAEGGVPRSLSLLLQ